MCAQCALRAHVQSMGYYAFVSRSKKSGSVDIIATNSVVIITNLSKSVLNRHEQVREWLLRSKSVCNAIAQSEFNNGVVAKDKTKTKRRKMAQTEEEIHRNCFGEHCARQSDKR